jgi:hypothetical protein
VDRADVIALLARQVPPPEGAEWRTSEVGSGIWFAVMYDLLGDRPRPFIGARTVICPNGRMLRFGSSPQVENSHAILEVLSEWLATVREFTDEEAIAEVARRSAEL